MHNAEIENANSQIAQSNSTQMIIKYLKKIEQTIRVILLGIFFQIVAQELVFEENIIDSTVIINSTFFQNIAFQSSRAGILNFVNCFICFYNSNFSNCLAQYGSPLFISFLKLSNYQFLQQLASIFHSNLVTLDGECIYAQKITYYNYTPTNFDILFLITNTLFINNCALSGVGGVIFLLNSDTHQLYHALIQNSTFYRNHALQGHIIYHSLFYNASFFNCLIQDLIQLQTIDSTYYYEYQISEPFWLQILSKKQKQNYQLTSGDFLPDIPLLFLDVHNQVIKYLTYIDISYILTLNIIKIIVHSAKKALTPQYSLTDQLQPIVTQTTTKKFLNYYACPVPNPKPNALVALNQSYTLDFGVNPSTLPPYFLVLIPKIVLAIAYVPMIIWALYAQNAIMIYYLFLDQSTTTVNVCYAHLITKKISLMLSSPQQ